jgi:hypothetical protein
LNGNANAQWSYRVTKKTSLSPLQMNLLDFDLVLPLNSKIIQVPSGSNSEAEVLTKIESLANSTAGCLFSDLQLQPSSCYELLLIGSVTASAVDVGSSDVSLTLVDGCGREHKINRIQDPDGKWINLLMRFKTSAAAPVVAGETKSRSISKLSIQAPRKFTLLLDHARCYLKQIRTSSDTCLVRRSNKQLELPAGFDKLPAFSSAVLRNYSLLHTLFDKIYVLNQDHQPHAWIECKHRLSEIGVSPTRVSISSVATAAGRETKSIVNVADDDAIVSVLTSQVKPLGLKRILFLRINCTAADPNFELNLYRSLCASTSPLDGKEPKMSPTSKGLMLFTSTNTSDSIVGFGISDKYYDEIISRYSASKSDGGVMRIIHSLCTDNSSDCHMIPDVLVTHGVRDARSVSHRVLEDVDSSHYVGIVVTVPRREFYSFGTSGTKSDESLSPLQKWLSQLVEQEYPYWSCVILTDPLRSATELKDYYRLRVEGDLKDERIKIVETSDPSAYTAALLSMPTTTTRGSSSDRGSSNCRMIVTTIDENKFTDPTFLGRLVYSTSSK